MNIARTFVLDDGTEITSTDLVMQAIVANHPRPMSAGDVAAYLAKTYPTYKNSPLNINHWATYGAANARVGSTLINLWEKGRIGRMAIPHPKGMTPGRGKYVYGLPEVIQKKVDENTQTSESLPRTIRELLARVALLENIVQSDARMRGYLPSADSSVNEYPEHP